MQLCVEDAQNKIDMYRYLFFIDFLDETQIQFLVQYKIHVQQSIKRFNGIALLKYILYCQLGSWKFIKKQIQHVEYKIVQINRTDIIFDV